MRTLTLNEQLARAVERALEFEQRIAASDQDGGADTVREMREALDRFKAQTLPDSTEGDYTRGEWKAIDGRSIFGVERGEPERPMIEVREGGYKTLVARFDNNTGFGTPFGGTGVANARRVAILANLFAGIDTDKLARLGKSTVRRALAEFL